MGVLTLNIEFRERGVKKTMQFEPRMVVYDACRLIRDKLGPLSDNRMLFLVHLKIKLFEFQACILNIKF